MKLNTQCIKSRYYAQSHHLLFNMSAKRSNGDSSQKRKRVKRLPKEKNWVYNITYPASSPDVSPEKCTNFTLQMSPSTNSSTESLLSMNLSAMSSPHSLPSPIHENNTDEQNNFSQSYWVPEMIRLLNSIRDELCLLRQQTNGQSLQQHTCTPQQQNNQILPVSQHHQSTPDTSELNGSPQSSPDAKEIRKLRLRAHKPSSFAVALSRRYYTDEERLSNCSIRGRGQNILPISPSGKRIEKIMTTTFRTFSIPNRDKSCVRRDVIRAIDAANRYERRKRK